MIYFVGFQVLEGIGWQKMEKVRGEGIGPHWLHDASDQARAKLLARGKTRTFKEREIVFRQGDTNSSIFLIKSGKLEDSRVNTDGEQVILRVLYPGHSVGEVGFGLEDPSPNTVTSITKTEVTVLKYADVIEVGREHPEILIGISKTLSVYVAIAVEWLDTALLSSVRDRILWRLRFITNYSSRGVDGWLRVEIAQADLADMVGITRQRVNQELKALEEIGLVKIEYRTIAINANMLKSMR